jgi:hypothetical protein
MQLQNGEAIIMVGRPSLFSVWPKYVFTLGLYQLWRKRNVLVLTDRRVVTGKGIFSRTERSTAMNRIQNATYVRNGLSAYCMLDSTSHGRPEVQRLGPLSARKARRFTDEIVSRG